MLSRWESPPLIPSPRRFSKHCWEQPLSSQSKNQSTFAPLQTGIGTVSRPLKNQYSSTKVHCSPYPTTMGKSQIIAIRQTVQLHFDLCAPVHPHTTAGASGLPYFYPGTRGKPAWDPLGLCDEFSMSQLDYFAPVSALED